ncbi:MAG TPA: hypothetical protein VN687_04285 [Blastocatellia bacterium]|nr:hypothetical protein [Blastocatellia bacterium]
MIRIGVTGHRILAELDKIELGVEEALIRVEHLFPGETLTVVSALAEGADRIAAWHVLARPDASLVVPLPLDESDYIRDFASDESRAEFSILLKRASRIERMPPAPARDQAYEAAGEYVLNNSDVLLTIWDGRPGQGLGGTADIVSRARTRKLRIAWVHAGNREPGANQPTTLGNEQGQVTFENF